MAFISSLMMSKVQRMPRADDKLRQKMLHECLLLSWRISVNNIKKCLCLLIRNNVWIVKQSRRYWPYLTAWYLQPLCKQPLWSDFKGSVHIRRGCSISHSIGDSWDWGAEHNRAELTLPSSLIQGWEWKEGPPRAPENILLQRRERKKFSMFPLTRSC